jgi:hypothetical protein
VSTTYRLECDFCKESIWIGQRDYIYTDDSNTMRLLSGFLFRHSGLDNAGIEEPHKLFFRSSRHSKVMNGEDGWSEIER